MLDLETMGNGPHAAIVAIGAVLFDDITEQLGESFYTRIDLASAVNLGGVIDADTVQWWLRQSADAREQVDGSQPAVHMAVALADFADYIAQHSDARRVRMWGNGAAFDNVILASSYRRAGIIAPWRYTNDRCYRTVKADHPDIELQRTGTHHNALDDAISQAQHLIAMRNSKGPAAAPRAAQQPSDEELRAAYQAAAPQALAWPWPEGLRAVIDAFAGTAHAAPVAPTGYTAQEWEDAKLRGIASDYFPDAKDWPAAMHAAPVDGATEDRPCRSSGAARLVRRLHASEAALIKALEGLLGCDADMATGRPYDYMSAADNARAAIKQAKEARNG